MDLSLLDLLPHTEVIDLELSFTHKMSLQIPGRLFFWYLIKNQGKFEIYQLWSCCAYSISISFVYIFNPNWDGIDFKMGDGTSCLEYSEWTLSLKCK